MTLALLTAALIISAPGDPRPYAIEVLDSQTGRGVPLVELKTTSSVTYVTDSAGLAAIDDPAILNQRAFFHVKSPGYLSPSDGFGMNGVALDLKPGGSAQIKIKRTNIAERLYRVTGEGIYRDSVVLGRTPPIRQPLLNARVSGCDSVNNVIYNGKLYWFWGDTSRPAYPLGNFHASGATSQLPASGGLDPARGIDLEYFTGDDGFSRPTAKMPGEGPTWISGLVALPDKDGRQRMLCGYVKVKQPLSVYRHGIAEWNDEASEFRHVADFSPEATAFPEGNPLLHKEGDTQFVYFASTYALVRVRATAEAYRDPAAYEAYTCLKPGSTRDKPAIDRDDTGRARYSWKRGALPVGPEQQAKLIRAGHLKSDEALIQTRDVATGKEIMLHAGSIYWNEYRQRFVMVAVQQYGSSFLGEVWYSEAPAPLGPWPHAVKIVTHDKYSFYNPKQNPYFDQDGGRVVYFEGTYSHTFSGNEHPTPRYDYNQLMHRLDLSDPRLKLP